MLFRSKHILENGILTKQQIEEIEKRIEDEIEVAVEHAKNEPSPKPSDALKYVYFEEGA